MQFWQSEGLYDLYHIVRGKNVTLTLRLAQPLVMSLHLQNGVACSNFFLCLRAPWCFFSRLPELLPLKAATA